ncbi:hypothetical protein P781_08440 [Vibrio mimicus CAIM 1883]|nr:hypothetical protein P781_08440 [Vibrio mimicus CAIM 1883]ERM56351.1 hypothetical protein P780_08395 [Vibrio mimicus CAIM 1882]
MKRAKSHTLNSDQIAKWPKVQQARQMMGDKISQ